MKKALIVFIFGGVMFYAELWLRESLGVPSETSFVDLLADMPRVFSGIFAYQVLFGKKTNELISSR